HLLKKDGALSYIMPHKFMNANYGAGIRGFLQDKKFPYKVILFGSNQVFEDATTYTGIFFMAKSKNQILEYLECDTPSSILDAKEPFNLIDLDSLSRDNWIFTK